MLIKFTLENYKSFKSKSVLSAVTSSLSGLRDSNIINTKRISLLKGLSIYGPNASGKSNLIDGIAFMQWLVTNSSKNTQQNEAIDVDPFRLNTSTENAPSKFEIEFLIDENRYRYGFATSRTAIDSEWLFVTKRSAEKPLFLRKEKNFKIFNGFKEGEGLASRTRDNALFLSLVAQLNGSISGKIINWFDKIQPVSGLEPGKYADQSIRMLLDKDKKNHLIDAIKTADLGIEDLEFVKGIIGSENMKDIPEGFANILSDNIRKNTLGYINTLHKKFNADNEFIGYEKFTLHVEESKGTEKFFNIIGSILASISRGEIIIIDEIDARLHPFLTKYIIKLFNSPMNLAGQIIFATHDTNLLDNKLMRRDQIYFVEKDNYGSSNLYSLVEFKHRKDSPIDKNYMEGKFGAIPFIDFAESNSN